MKGKLFSGTSGLQLALPKRDFPEEFAQLSRLGYYALQLNSLEVNSSLNRLPQAKTVSKWAAEVPADFRFTFKLWREITHQKNLVFNKDDIHRFMTTLAGADTHRGAVLIQFPPGLQDHAFLQLRELLMRLSDYNWPLAVEFRHVSWYRDEVYELLHSHQAALVLQDMPASATPWELTADTWTYLRFHGPSGDYRGSYADDFLSEYGSYVRDWLDEGKMVYAYFNNTVGAALQNLQTLNNDVDQ